MNRVIEYFTAFRNTLILKLGIKSSRTKNITKHVFFSFLFKAGSILANFLLIPLTIDFLDTENYGIWLTISSFVSWFSFFDIGLGNGLRNKFTETTSKSDYSAARSYVSTTYFTIFFFSIFLFTFFIVANYFINWSKVFNVSVNFNHDLTILMPIVFGLFCMQLVLKLITTIYTADQHHSMQGRLFFIIQLLTLIFIWVLNTFSKSSLLHYGIVFSLMPVLILLCLNIIAFKGRYRYYKPSLLFWNRGYLKDVFGLGLSFFIIQIAGVILFTTDNIIITQLFGAAEVVPYNMAYKYFSILNMTLTIISSPFWSSITNAYTQGDYVWIKKAMKNLVYISIGAIFIILAMILFADSFYHIWLGKKVIVPLSLTIYMGLFFMVNNSYSSFTYFLNATGKIKLQMFTVVFMSLVNIPLAIYFAKNLNFGVSGVIFSTTLCLLPHCILLPIQYHKIINNKARGIWSK